jgi:hypothetical protein
MAAIEQEVVDKIIRDIKESHEKGLQMFQKMTERTLDLLRTQQEEKVAELTKQNDGLLGAVGRLQGEKAKFEEQVDDLQEEMRKVKMECELRLREERTQLEETIRRHNEESDLERRKAEEEIVRERRKDREHISELEKLLKRLQAKKPRK